MAIAYCPDCDGSVSLGPEPRIGQRVTCPHCDAELEVVETSPPELDWAYDEMEIEWGDEEEWDEEEDWDEES